jgi:AraC-like DNA-binding protein
MPSVPTYDFYKTLDTPLNFEYSRLEKAYNSYDASHAHRHDYYEVLIFDRTGGTHDIDFVTYPVKRDTIHFLSPGQVHLLKRNKNVTGHVLAFKEEAFISSPGFHQQLLMPSPAVNPVMRLNKEQRRRIDRALMGLITEFDSRHSYLAQSLGAYLVLFLIEVIQLFDDTHQRIKNSAATNLYHNFRRLIDKNIMTTHSVSAYASLLNITPGHLNDTVKDQSGKSASDLIHERVILEAKRLLYHSTLSIKEIAALLNYDEPAYFIRFFKTRVKMTPREFRDGSRG